MTEIDRPFEEERGASCTDSAGCIDGYSDEDSDEKLAIQIPTESFDEHIFQNLDQVLENKGRLIRDALGTKSLDYTVDEQNVSFPWFTIFDDEPAEVQEHAYTDFILALFRWAKDRKRVNNVIDNSQNERYAFRCFLLRLGMVGEEYRDTRRILLKRLDGDCAFKGGKEARDAKRKN